MRSRFQRLLSGALPAAALACLAGCAVPLAPGYAVEKQSITVQFIPGTSPHLAIRAEYRLRNVGNVPLSSMDIALPDRSGFGSENLRIEVGGHPVTPQFDRGETPDEGESAISESWPNLCTIPFSPAWPRKKRVKLLIEYTLNRSPDSDPRISIGPAGFYLNDSGWFPDPLAPQALFAKDILRPDFSELHVEVPENFLVAASGALHSTHAAGGGKDSLFLLRRYAKASFMAKTDFDPYIVAGHYHQLTIGTNDGEVAFWLFQSSSESQLRPLAQRLSTTRNFLSSTFGALPRVNQPILVVQSPVTESADAPAAPSPSFPVLPDVIFITPQELSDASRSAAAQRHLQEQLALTWFEHLMTPRPEAWLLGGALAAYAVTQEREKSQAAEMRNDAIRRLLQSYRQAGPSAVENPIAFVKPSDPPEARRRAAAKLSLFIFALEDRCGPQNVSRAISHMMYALRGNPYGYADFRAALEEASHQGLAGLFTAWLDQKGIPKDFLAKYGAQAKMESKEKP